MEKRKGISRVGLEESSECKKKVGSSTRRKVAPSRRRKGRSRVEAAE